MAAGMSCKHNKQCSCFVVIFFADIHIVINVGCFEYTFTNVDKAASNADFPKSEMPFSPQYWTIISFPNLGKTASNIGVLFHLPSLEILVLTLDFQYIY